MTEFEKSNFNNIIKQIIKKSLFTERAILINYAFPWRRYPAILSRPTKKAPASGLRDPVLNVPDHDEIIMALRSLNSFIDISEEDLQQLVIALAPGRTREQIDSRVDSLPVAH